jgi:hypothetical protein
MRWNSGSSQPERSTRLQLCLVPTHGSQISRLAMIFYSIVRLICLRTFYIVSVLISPTSSNSV